jgi:hypothetical protein
MKLTCPQLLNVRPQDKLYKRLCRDKRDQAIARSNPGIQ